MEYEGDYTPEVSGLDLLREIADENGITGVKLFGILDGSRMLGSMILRGERRITTDDARRLGEYFKLSAGAFL